MQSEREFNINDEELKTYDDAMNIFSDLLGNVDWENYTELKNIVGDFQQKFMMRQLNNYKEIVETDADEIIADVFEYIILHSESGHCREEIESEELAIEITQKYDDVLGYFMTDDSCVYEDNGKYFLDVIFYGHYVPYWNGWRD